MQSARSRPSSQLLFDCVRWRVDRHKAVGRDVECIGLLAQFSGPRMATVCECVHGYGKIGASYVGHAATP